MLVKLSLYCLTGLTALMWLTWKRMGLILRKKHLSRCWDYLSLLNWIGPLTLYPVLKLAPRKLKLLLVLWSFFLMLLLFISLSLYCCRVLVGVPSCYLAMLDTLQKQICRTVGLTLAASFSPWLIIEMKPA